MKGLPSPVAGALTCYFLGPGFGESQVLVLPDGRTVVVDCCRRSGAVLPLELLRQIGKAEVDLLVVSHGDLDHVAGLPELIGGVSVKEVWRYPDAWVNDLAAAWLRQDPNDARLMQLHAGLAALDRLEDSGIPVWRASHGHRAWPHQVDAPFRLVCFAPTRHDIARKRAWLQRLIELSPEGPRLPANMQEFLLGERGSPGGGSNALSLGVSLTWGKAKLLLCGDVEEGSADPRSGWEGVLRQLAERGEEALLQDASVVKVAHHGSKEAFSERAWRQHALHGLVQLAVISPFSKQMIPLPHEPTVGRVGSFALRVGLTATTDEHALLFRRTGWESDPVAAAGEGPWLAVDLDAEANLTTRRGDQASVWVVRGRT